MKYTKDFLESLISESKSMLELFNKLGIKNTGGGATHVYKKIKEYGIDRSHFTKKGVNDLSVHPIEDYFDNKRRIKSNNLKKRLFLEGIKEKRCECCNAETWLGWQMTFELHHIDENHNNNALENLQIVCPNCHSMIHHKINEERYRKPVKKLAPGNVRISYLKPNSRKVDRPSLEVLEHMTKELGFSATARVFGVADNTVRKWIRTYKKYSEQ